MCEQNNTNVRIGYSFFVQNVAPSEKINKKPSKVKKAPDFSKLHRKWEGQLAKVGTLKN